AAEWNIFGIPSFVVIQDGKELGRLVNKDRKTKQEIESFLESVIKG
ncbi:thioredoxin family protein, partial [Enterococcus faecium]